MNNYEKLLNYGNSGESIEIEYMATNEEGKIEEIAIIKSNISILEIDLHRERIYLSLPGHLRYKGILEDNGIIMFENKKNEDRKYGFFDVSKIDIKITKIGNNKWNGLVKNK